MQAALDIAPLRDVVGFLLTLAAVAARQTYQASIGVPFELRTVEFTLLLLLLGNHGAAPKQLGRTMRMTAPNVTVLLDRMTARGLLERRRSSRDGRAIEVVLTADGQALAERVQAVSRTMEDGLLAALSPGERVLLRELLIKVGGAAG